MMMPFQILGNRKSCYKYHFLLVQFVLPWTVLVILSLSDENVITKISRDIQTHFSYLQEIYCMCERRN